MPLQLRLRLTGMPGSRNVQQGKNGLGQHPGRIVTDAVNHDRKPQLMQEHRQQRRQVRLLARAIVAGDNDRHRLACRRGQAQRMLLHRGVKAFHLRFAFAFDAQGD
ncbi:hypothetical protein SB00610_03237 [Klebsiella quasipneumoniae subsp. similipneumoniae]|nr:hypothetical protein SB00610_03237 [Klebsiella quasipneumoniae subsp. similipneumoniae]